MRVAVVPLLSSILASQRWIARTWRGFFAATAVRLLRRSTRRCATDRCCGPADGGHRNFPLATWSRLERHQDADLSNPYSASGVRAGTAGARLSLPALAVHLDLRFIARQPDSRLRRATNPDGFLHALPGLLRHVPVSRSERSSGHESADRHRQRQYNHLPIAACDGLDAARWGLSGTNCSA